MYDVGNSTSFDEIVRYYQDFLAERRLQARKPCILARSPACLPRPAPYPVLLYVFANKNDGEPDKRIVPEHDGRAFANFSAVLSICRSPFAHGVNLASAV